MLTCNTNTISQRFLRYLKGRYSHDEWSVYSFHGRRPACNLAGNRLRQSSYNNCRREVTTIPAESIMVFWDGAVLQHGRTTLLSLLHFSVGLSLLQFFHHNMVFRRFSWIAQIIVPSTTCSLRCLRGKRNPPLLFWAWPVPACHDLWLSCESCRCNWWSKLVARPTNNAWLQSDLSARFVLQQLSNSAHT